MNEPAWCIANMLLEVVAFLCFLFRRRSSCHDFDEKRVLGEMLINLNFVFESTNLLYLAPIFILHRRKCIIFFIYFLCCWHFLLEREYLLVTKKSFFLENFCAYDIFYLERELSVGKKKFLFFWFVWENGGTIPLLDQKTCLIKY